MGAAIGRAACGGGRDHHRHARGVGRVVVAVRPSPVAGGDDPFETVPALRVLEAVRACFGPTACRADDRRDGRWWAPCPCCGALDALQIDEPWRGAAVRVRCVHGCAEREIAARLAWALQAPAGADPLLAPITDAALYAAEVEALQRRRLQGLLLQVTGEVAR